MSSDGLDPVLPWFGHDLAGGPEQSGLSASSLGTGSNG